jgi:hypothetical protein
MREDDAPDPFATTSAIFNRMKACRPPASEIREDDALDPFAATSAIFERLKAKSQVTSDPNEAGASVTLCGLASPCH